MLSYFTHQKGVADRRAEWGAEADTPVALFASRISPEKNLTLLSQAFKKMQQTQSRYALCHCWRRAILQAIQKRKPKRDLLPL